MKNNWSQFPLKGVLITSETFKEGNLIDSNINQYTVLSENSNIYFNFKNFKPEYPGLYKGCFLGKQKVILSSDNNFSAIYSHCNPLLDPNSSSIEEDCSEPAFFSIVLSTTFNNQHYCDIFLKTEYEKISIKENCAEAFLKGASFAVNGSETFSVWYDCSITRNFLLKTDSCLYKAPHINQWKVRSANFNNLLNNKILFPLEKWHSIKNGVRIYFDQTIINKPYINIIDNWYPYKNSKSQKNCYFVYKGATHPPIEGEWKYKKLNISGPWNGKLGTFKSINEVDGLIYKNSIKLY